MQFSREIFYCDLNSTSYNLHSVNRSVNFTSFMKSCGFVNTDGSEINLNEPAENIKWKYDSQTNGHFIWAGSTNERYFFVDQNGFISDTSYITNPHIGVTGSGYFNCMTFFIPLKNRGFLISAYGADATIEGYSNTPKIYSYNHFPGYTETNRWASGWHSEVLSFYNNIINNYNCIYSRIGAYGTSETSHYMHDSSVRLPLSTNSATLTQYGSRLLDWQGDRTDIKQNTLTLIKAPYHNSFLNNLYIATTIPKEGISVGVGSEMIPLPSTGLDNKFFSFNGRNFYGVYGNLVVELPAN